MKRDWKEYNKQLVNRGEIIIDKDIFLSENTLPFSLNPQVQKLKIPNFRTIHCG